MIHYNVHDLLHIRSDEPLLNRAFHRYFAVDHVPDPDVIVRTNSAPAASLDGLERHDNWYYGAPNADWVVYDDRLLGQHERVSVKHLLSDAPTVIEAGTLRWPDVTPRSRGSVSDLVESVIDVHLIEHGYTTIHAATLSKDGRAVLLAGFPNVGKTLSTLALLRDGWAYMGDDNGVIGEDGTTLAYPSTSSIGYHDFLKFIDPEAIGRKRYYKHLARVWPMQNAIVERLLDYPEVYLPDIGFDQGDRAETAVAACLAIGERDVTPVGPNALADKIIASTDYSRPRPWQNPFLHVYDYFNDGFCLDLLQQRERQLVADHLRDAACYTLACQHREWSDLLDDVLAGIASDGDEPAIVWEERA